MEHNNFYETLREARMRLQYTLVLYGGEPYQVSGIVPNWEDHIFRLYLFDISQIKKHRCPNFEDYEEEYIEDWRRANPNVKLVKKKINSPKFNKFRPFPLGMVNHQGNTFYVARQPIRKSEQGLIDNALNRTLLSVDDGTSLVEWPCLYDLTDCIKGLYPAPELVLTALGKSSKFKGAGFSRDFALVRGDFDLFVLCYRSDKIGYLPYRNFKELHLSPAFSYCKEVVQELNLFDNILIPDN